ncbi:MAG: outer membrane protein assembly factor BamD [Opitutales bacterium]|nr:outer membrane protein assembly factor BamD [Opitutales bacterium]
MIPLNKNPKGLLFALCFFVLATLQMEAISWNPLQWFRGDDGKERRRQSYMASPEEQAIAQEMFKKAQDLAFAGKTGKASEVFEDISKEYTYTAVAPRALFNWAKIYESEHKFKKAFGMYQNIILLYPEYEGFDQVIGAQFELATRIMEGDREKIWGTIPLFRYYQRAIQFFQVISRNAPYSDYAPLSLMNIALIAKDLGKEAIAIDALDQLINFYPGHELTPDAYFLLAEVFSDLIEGPGYDQGSTREAISYYEDFLILYPDSQLVTEAEDGLREVNEIYAQSKYQMGEYYLRHIHNETAALALYNETITVAPNSETAELARQRIDQINARTSNVDVIGSNT